MASFWIHHFITLNKILLKWILIQRSGIHWTRFSYLWWDKVLFFLDLNYILLLVIPFFTKPNFFNSQTNPLLINFHLLIYPALYALFCLHKFMTLMTIVYRSFGIDYLFPLPLTNTFPQFVINFTEILQPSLHFSSLLFILMFYLIYYIFTHSKHIDHYFHHYKTQKDTKSYKNTQNHIKTLKNPIKPHKIPKIIKTQNKT